MMSRRYPPGLVRVDTMAESDESQLGPFPTVDEVLNNLKSSGTFDQFRKTCLGSIEAEPSFRAYGEHIEVVTRRYLQNYKWRDSTTKNQVRSRLKSHALSVIASPDIQVGVPFSSLVEKAMESQGKELLPKIQSVITSLRQTKPQPADDTTTKTSKSNAASATTTTTSSSILSKSGVEFDLSLPIDLPGLVSTPHTTTTTTSAIPSKKSAPSDAKVNRVKTKAGESSSKESAPPRSGSSKVKTQASDGKTDATTSKDVRTKEEKREKTSSAPAADESGSREDKKAPKIKKSREEPKEKVQTVEKSKEASKSTGNEDVADDTKEAKTRSRPDPTTTSSKEPEEQAEVHGGSSKKSGDGEGEGKEKQLPPRRRSARIASLTEEPKKNEESEHEDDTRDHRPKRRLSGHTAASEVDTQTKPGRKKVLTKTFSRKRTRAWESDSSGESEEHALDGSKHSKMEKAKSRKQSRKRTPEQLEPPVPVRRSRRHSKTGSDSPSSSTQTLEKMDQEQPHSHTTTTTSRRKSKQPQRVVPSRSSRSPLKSPPTPIVTRFNRHVKPNRKYYDSDQEDEEEEEEEEEEEAYGSAESDGHGNDDADSKNDKAYMDDEEMNSSHSEDETMSEQND